MVAWKFIWKTAAPLFVVAMIFFLGFLNLKSWEGVARDADMSNYCQEHAREMEMCGNVPQKLSEYIIIYYDGLPKMYLNHLKRISQNREHIALNKICHVGISDSVPAFYTYLSGRIAFNYEGNLEAVDNLFTQLKSARKDPTIYFYPKMAKLFRSGHLKMQLSYSNEFSQLLSQSFLDWVGQYFFNPKYVKRRVADDLLVSNEEKEEYFLKKLARFREIIKRRISWIFYDLDNKLRQEKNFNPFIYIPILDNFTHWVTMSNKRYIASVAMIIANLEVLIEYLSKRQSNRLLAVLSDHGGDESVEEQEKRNHSDPLSTIDNSSFLMLFNRALNTKDYNELTVLKSTEVAGTIAFHVTQTSIPVFSRPSQFYFNSPRLNLLYQAAHLQKELDLNTRICPAHSKHSLIKDLIDKCNKMGDSEQKNSEVFLKTLLELEKYSDQLAKENSLLLKSQNQKMAWCFSLLLFIIISKIFILPFIKRFPFMMKKLSKENQIFLLHAIIVQLIICVVCVILSDIDEKFIFTMTIAYFLSGVFIERISRSHSRWMHIGAITCAILWIYRLLAENHLSFFYNNKVPSALFLGYGLLLAWVIRFLFIKERRMVSIFARISSLAMFAIVAGYDVLSIPASNFDPSEKTIKLVWAFNLIMCLQISLTFFMSLEYAKELTLISFLLFVYWINALHYRLLYAAIILPGLLMFKSKLLKESPPSKIKAPAHLFFTILMVMLFELLVEGYKFDWNNRRRLLHKFNMLIFYRSVNQISAVILAFYIFGSRFGSKSVIQFINFVFGTFFLIVVLNFEFEYRMAVAKFFESLFITFCLVIIWRLRALFENKPTRPKEASFETSEIDMLNPSAPIE